jgi:YidC/Oxa1 family membrane protein insertase
MPETVNGGSGNQPPKEMSMELRLLVAFLLMGAVMFLTPYFFKSQAPTPAQKAAQSSNPPAPAAGEQPPATEAPSAATPKAAAAAPTAPKTPEQTLPPLVIDTDLFRVTLSNQGANVRSWQLKSYKGNDGKPLELVNTASGLEYPFSLYFNGQKPATDVNWAWFKQAVTPDGLGVDYEYSDGHTAVRKSFRFQKNSYLSTVTSAVTVDGKPLPAMLAWRGGFGDLTVSNPAGDQNALYFNLTDNKLVEQTARSVKNGPVTASGNFSFAGLADTYFAAVLLPEGGTHVDQVTLADTVRTPLDEKQLAFPGVAVSDGPENQFEVYVGPKDLDILGRVNPKLTQVVDFGFLAVLSKPLFLIVNWFNDAFVHNFGWSIVVVTFVINMILFPLKLSNMKSMKKMQALKPQIDAIAAKYKGLKMTDPKKSEQQQETMDLYKKYGVNPMGGCVPMLIQLPFFIAFYKVFKVSVEMRGAHWLWVTDLSQPEHYVIKVLPLIMIGTQFLMQKMTPQAPGQDPSQQKMMMFMPLVFGYMFYWFPSGLVLYYLTSNLVSMGQQWFFNHTELATAAALSVEPPKKKTGRK